VVFSNNLHQAFDDFFGVLLVRVSDAPLVAGLRPSTDLDSMNFLAFYLFRIDYMAKPEHENARCVRICKHCGVPRVSLRANIDETLTAAIITEQGGKEKHRERSQEFIAFCSQFWGRRSTGQGATAHLHR
jgi:hypothetical protein